MCTLKIKIGSVCVCVNLCFYDVFLTFFWKSDYLLRALEEVFLPGNLCFLKKPLIHEKSPSFSSFASSGGTFRVSKILLTISVAIQTETIAGRTVSPKCSIAWLMTIGSCLVILVMLRVGLSTLSIVDESPEWMKPTVWRDLYMDGFVFIKSSSMSLRIVGNLTKGSSKFQRKHCISP